MSERRWRGFWGWVWAGIALVGTPLVASIVTGLYPALKSEFCTKYPIEYLCSDIRAPEPDGSGPKDIPPSTSKPPSPEPPPIPDRLRSIYENHNSELCGMTVVGLSWKNNAGKVEFTFMGTTKSIGPNEKLTITSTCAIVLKSVEPYGTAIRINVLETSQ
jgi:hypothetical protein